MWPTLRAHLVLAGIFIGMPLAIFLALPKFMDYATCATHMTAIPYPADMRKGGKPIDFEVGISKKACKTGDGSSIRHITQIALRQADVLTFGFPKAKPDYTTDTFFEFNGDYAAVPQWREYNILVIEHSVPAERIERQAVIWSGIRIEYRSKAPG